MGKIYTKEFHKDLKKIQSLRPEERKYVEERFKDSLEGGMGKEEFKREIERLKHDYKDKVKTHEVKKIEKEFKDDLYK